MEHSSPDALIEFLAPYPEHVQQLTLQGRRFLLERLSPVSEIFWDATQAVCSGFTYTHGTRDNFINLAVYPKHVTLIFPWGTRLDDPEQRLKGEGNRVRHIRLTGMETLEDPYVLGLIEQAQHQATRPPEPLEPITIVKIMNGPKRRPISQ